MNNDFPKIVTIRSFPVFKRGNWLLKISYTSLESFSVFCANVKDSCSFVKFFSKEHEALAFIDFLVQQETYSGG